MAPQVNGSLDQDDPVWGGGAGSNNPPSAPRVTITPANPTAADRLHCEAAGSVDPDGDAVTYSYQWYKNGVIRLARAWQNVDPGRTAPGDVWRCVVTPSDGNMDGPAGEATVTIAGGGA